MLRCGTDKQNFIQDRLIYLAELERNIRTCQKSRSAGIISSTDAAAQIDMIEKQRRKTIKALVDAVHITKGGAVRKIWQHEPTDSYKEGYWQTKVPQEGGRKDKLIKAKTEEELYEKLYKHYYSGGGGLYTIGRIFEMALGEKISCKNPSENTITHDRNDYKRFITEDFANKNIVEVQVEDLQEYTQRLVHRLALKKQAFTAYKVVLNLIFGYALRHGVIAQNPVNSIDNDVYLKSCDCTKKKAETETFSAKELDAIHKEMERRKGLKRYQNCFGYDFAVRFAEATGARAGEIVSLKWDDIDYETKVVHIHTQQLLTHDEDGHIQYVIADYTKNERGIPQGGRYFPLTRKLKALFEEVRTKNAEMGLDPEYVFVHADGEWFTKNEYNKYLNHLCKRAGVSITKNHAFRKTVNSEWKRAGISDADRAETLGHSVETNIRHYTYESRECADKMRKMLDQKEKGTIYEEKGTLNTIPFAKRKSPKHLSL